jgi:serine protease Do
MMRGRITLVLGLMLALLLSGTSSASSQTRREKKIVVTQRSPRQGWLGVQIQDMTAERAAELKVAGKEGALVTDVTADSPAEKAGIKKDDIVVEFNGRTIYDGEDLMKAVRRTKPGTGTAVVVERKDGRKTLQVTVGKMKSDPWGIASAAPLPPVAPKFRFFRNTVSSGLHLTDLTPQLGEYFGAPGGKGVLVEEVETESEGAKAGFKAGDVILRIGDEKIEDLGDVSDAFEDFKDGEKANVEILRKGSRQTLTLTIDDEEISGLEQLSPSGERELRERFEKIRLQFGPEWRAGMQTLRHELEHMGSRVRLHMNNLRSTFAQWSRVI